MRALNACDADIMQMQCGLCVRDSLLAGVSLCRGFAAMFGGGCDGRPPGQSGRFVGVRVGLAFRLHRTGSGI